jgi:hypothetical protein
MKKYLSYILILIALIGAGLFGLAGKVSAQTAANGDCTITVTSAAPINRFLYTAVKRTSSTECASVAELEVAVAKEKYGGFPKATGEWKEVVKENSQAGGSTSTKTPFETEIGQNLCGFGKYLGGEGSTFYPGCFIQISYGLFYVIPSFLLLVSAYFFNVLILITLSGKLFANSTFIPTAWAVVRDLSNIFFILILLYIAVKIILNLGGSEAKKMIAKVIIIALLINFSMFFTEVIIDTSNILALIFYNKMEVSTKNADGSTREYQKTAAGEKDVAGGMVNAFNPTSLLTAEFFGKLKTQPIGGVTASPGVSGGILIGVTIIAGLLMFFAAYAFFVAGISFVGRMIELFVLIIFSPFAFMSSTIPLLGSVEYLGWDAWFKRLLKTAFMAPIFMFFLYFIFMLIQAKIFDQVISKTNSTFIETILLIVIPALVILILLLKATEFAKKGSGALGEKLMTGAKLIGGVALGAATGGVALAGTGIIGGLASKTAGSEGLKEAATKGTGLEKFGARMALRAANYGAGASFDVRQTGLGKIAAKKSGMDFSKGLGVVGLDTKSFEGGRKKQIEHMAEEEEKLVKTFELSKSAGIKQDARNKQYEEDKKKARQFAEDNGFGADFNEKQFKNDYENGDNLKEYGLNKTVDKGDVGSAKDVNKERRTAYANSLDKEGKEAAKSAVGAFFAEWAKGSAKMISTPTGIAATVAGSVLPGVGTVATIIGGGFLQALKKQSLGVTNKNSEVIAAIRKGEDPLKHALHEIAKATASHDEKHEEHPPEAHKKEDGHAEPAHTPTPAAHPPTGGNHPSH